MMQRLWGLILLGVLSSAAVAAEPLKSQAVVGVHEQRVIEEDLDELTVSGRALIKSRIGVLVFADAIDVVIEGEVARTRGHGVATFMPGSILRGREITQEQKRIFD